MAGEIVIGATQEHGGGLTLADAARMMREAVKDKSYRAFPMGQEAAHYLRWKRRQITPASYRDYEGCFDKLARFFLDLELKDFEPPLGTERLEEFLEYQWGDAAPRTYNKNLSYVRDFFKWATLARRLYGDPARGIPRARTAQPERVPFTADQFRLIVDSQPELRDRVALRILFHTGIRKGALRGIQFKHFDHLRRRVLVRTKGGSAPHVPVVDMAIWNELELLILEREARSDDYLLNRRHRVPAPWQDGEPQWRWKEIVAEPMSDHGAHNWWYECLARAGVVPEGVTRGENMHKARHTAGQLLLDKTKGNLKAVQRLLGHSSIETTGDVYVDWDLDQLAQVMREALEE